MEDREFKSKFINLNWKKIVTKEEQCVWGEFFAIDLTQGFSAVVLLIFWVGEVWAGAALCTTGCLLASLASAQ